MDPVTLSIGAGLAGFNALTGFFGQKSQNSSNMRLAQYQNAWNEKMYEKQKADQIEFWNMQNEYNDPKNVLARMTNAGINPRAQNAQGWANATEMQAPKAQPAADMEYKSPLFAFTELSGIVSAIKDLELKDAQIDEVKSRAGYNNALSAFTLTKDNVEDAKFELWRAMNYLDDGYGGYKIPDNLRGVGIGKILAEVSEKGARARYQNTLADILDENQALGMDPNGTWLDSFYRQFMRHSFRRLFK